MRNIRIGKDIAVKWHIFRNENGERLPFEIDETAELKVQTPYEMISAENFKISGNAIEWVFRGADQKYCGIYNLILVQKEGAAGMVTVDTCKAFALVGHSCEETPAVGGDVVADAVMLEGEVAFAPVVVEVGGGGSYDDTELRGMIEENEQKLTELSAEVSGLSVNKQDKISDLDSIRSGAALGATALQTETYKGTVTGVKINGSTKSPTSGVVDLGTVITSHQDISGKADKSSLATVATSGSYNDLSNKPTIPSAVTESTVSGWGFTKNAGTITGIKMNGASKGTSGVVDLGTVLTSHQSLSGYATETYVQNQIAAAITTALNTAV